MVFKPASLYGRILADAQDALLNAAEIGVCCNVENDHCQMSRGDESLGLRMPGRGADIQGSKAILLGLPVCLIG
jgi:hypothetical protein